MLMSATFSKHRYNNGSWQNCPLFHSNHPQQLKSLHSINIYIYLWKLCRLNSPYNLHNIAALDCYYWLELHSTLQSFQMAVELSPQMTSALMNLGAVFHLMVWLQWHSKFSFLALLIFLQGNYTEAKHYYTIALKRDPTNTILQQNLQKLQRLQKSASSKG